MLGVLFICVCMHVYVLSMHVCMYAIRRADRRAGWCRCVSQVEYACIMNVCIYRRAGSTIYVCMHALCIHVYSMYLCTLFGTGWYRSNVICMYYDCMCNELGEVNAGWIPARPASVDQDHTRNNRHNPWMV